MRILVLLVLFLSGPAFADHLPDALMAQGKPETFLCGIDVNRTTLSELRTRFGSPTTYKAYPETVEAAEITWEAHGSSIHATINTDDIAYAVDVTGKPSPITRTGRGLALGQILEDLRHIYGPKFLRQGSNVTLQWEDGTELRVRLKSGRVTPLELIASVE